MNTEELRSLIIHSLQNQGFSIKGRRIFPPTELDKNKVRDLHTSAVEHRIEKFEKTLFPYEPRLLERLATGRKVFPERIEPKLVEVKRGSEDELLFRYACLHWSIPVSSGYGRRLRFLVIDRQNEKLIGLFGLGDPVFSLSSRDNWIGWDKDTRRDRLHHVMDAFVLGAVPPYSFLLCGKLVAMLAASDEVRGAFKKKYGGRQSIINQKRLDARLALLTTTSALGRSSIYNRMRFREQPLYTSVGFTQGSGEFHFSNGLYGAISDYTERYCEPTAKQKQWGTGFRSRREVIRKCLAGVGLSTEWLYHGIRREVFVVPLARNTRQFLRGEHSKLMWKGLPATDIFLEFRKRWLIPRSQRDLRYLDFKPIQYQLWSRKGL